MEPVTLIAMLMGCLLAQLSLSKPAPPKEVRPTATTETQMLKALLAAYVDTRQAPPS